MSEEIIDTILPEEPEGAEKPSLLPGFKSICMRIGLMMIVVFVSRYFGNIFAALIMPLASELDTVPFYLLDVAISVVFLYAIPIIAAVFILKNPLKGKKPYSHTKYFGKAMGLFPAAYGAAIFVRILTLIAGAFLQGTDLEDSFNATSEALATPNMATAVILFVQLTVIAPIFEELWFRGLVLESLRPYGNGFAIFISALLFGMTHANFEQFFYATTIGIVLGYIAVSTGSLVTTTIMHAILNSISGIMLLLAADEGVGDYLLAAQRGEEGVITASVVLYIIWLVAVMLLLAVGVVMAIYKLIKIKRYRVPKVQTELSAPCRWGIFLSRATVIIMLLLAADTFVWNFIPRFIYGLIAGG